MTGKSLLHHERGVVPPYNFITCTNFLLDSCAVIAPCSGSGAPYYLDPATDPTDYVFALGARASRDLRGVATLGSDEP